MKANSTSGTFATMVNGVFQSLLQGYLFNMLDEEFEVMEHEYRKYAIEQIHKPIDREEAEDFRRVFDELGKFVEETKKLEKS
jgi:hypothetical protein